MTLFLQMELVDSSRGRVMCELTVEKGHLNRGGNLHGGMTASIVDECTTLAIMMDQKPPGVSVDMSIT